MLMMWRPERTFLEQSDKYIFKPNSLSQSHKVSVPHWQNCSKDGLNVAKNKNDEKFLFRNKYTLKAHADEIKDLSTKLERADQPYFLHERLF